MSVKLLLDEKFLGATEALIKAAKKEVYVIAYLMMIPSEKRAGKEAKLYKELMEAQLRGVDCKVLLNYTHPPNKIVKQNVIAGRWMGVAGIECRFVARNRTVHAKMIIIDGVTLIVGSHNWSQRAIERNVEASVEMKELPIVKEARENFLELWKDGVSMERIH